MDNKKYESTHPWIKFDFDAKDFTYKEWILLGAAQSKCRHLSCIALYPESKQKLLRVYMQKGIQATTAIEGNTLSEEEIEKIIDGKNADIPKSKEYQEQEIKNVLEAYNNIADDIKNLRTGNLSFEQIKSDNRTILQKIAQTESVMPGEIRTHSVVVGGAYRGAPAEDCEYLLRELCDWLNKDWGFDNDNKIIEVLLKAVMAHLYIAWIHPFGDGNGRTARVLELRVLMNGGVPDIASHLLSNFYNETRSDYYSRLSEASGNRSGNPAVFISYALQGFVDELDKQIKIILEEQLDVIWTNYIYSKFSGELSSSRLRKRELLLDISKYRIPIDRDELIIRLNVKTLSQYQNKSSMTFYRDIKQLVNDKFLKDENGKISANKDQLQGFLPISKNKL